MDATTSSQTAIPVASTQAWRSRFFQKRDGSSMPGTHPPARPAGWHDRGYLPHLDRPGMRQGLTFRLADAVPAFLITKWKKELDLLEPHCGTTCWTEEDDAKWEVFNRRIAKYEDAGRGECLLRQPAMAAVVSDCLLHFSGERYDLLAWCVMPNHVHAVVAMKEGHAIGSSVKSWKGFSARKINQMLGREGRPLWFPDYHDRFMRNADHTHRAIAYVENNPVAAGLVASAQEWRWSSAGQPLAGRTASIPARKAVDGM